MIRVREASVVHRFGELGKAVTSTQDCDLLRILRSACVTLRTSTLDMQRQLPCKHQPCIDSWVERYRTCPLCRYLLWE